MSQVRPSLLEPEKFLLRQVEFPSVIEGFGPTWSVGFGHGAEPNGKIDPKLPGKIEAFRTPLGSGVYTKILWGAAFSHDARLTPNANRQKDALRWMEAAARGYERVSRISSEAEAIMWKPCSNI